MIIKGSGKKNQKENEEEMKHWIWEKDKKEGEIWTKDKKLKKENL